MGRIEHGPLSLHHLTTFYIILLVLGPQNLKYQNTLDSSPNCSSWQPHRNEF